MLKVNSDRTGLDDLPLIKDEVDPTIWRATFDFDPTRFLLYRFGLSLGTGAIFQEESEADQGRVVYMTNDVIILPLAHYNVLRDSSQNTVTFRVDMQAPTTDGRFDPVLDQIALSGPLLDDNPFWRVSFTKNLSMPYLYQATVPVLTALPGETVTYNYTLPHDAETIAPRTFVLQGGAQVLPIDYYDLHTDVGRLSILLGPDQTVTISWNAAAGVHLQRSGGLDGGWSTVNGTDGIGFRHAECHGSDDLFPVGHRPLKTGRTSWKLIFRLDRRPFAYPFSKFQLKSTVQVSHLLNTNGLALKPRSSRKCGCDETKPRIASILIFTSPATSQTSGDPFSHRD